MSRKRSWSRPSKVKVSDCKPNVSVSYPKVSFTFLIHTHAKEVRQVAQLWQRDRANSINDFKRILQIARNNAVLCVIKIELHYWWASGR